MSDFKTRLKELRSSVGLSQSALADELNTSKSSINMYERGEREPGIATLEAIADFFNVDMDYLLGKSDCKNRYLESLPSIAFSHSQDPTTQKILDATHDMTDEEKRQLLLAARLIVEQRSEK